MNNMTTTKSCGLAVWAQKYQCNDLDQLTVMYIQSCLSQFMHHMFQLPHWCLYYVLCCAICVAAIVLIV